MMGKAEGYVDIERVERLGRRTTRDQITQNITIFFRSLGLQLINAVSLLTAPVEPAKIAIHRNRRITALRLAIHVIPVTAALTLILLNAQNKIVFSSNPLTILQFVAKFHETLMQASIAALVMAYIRRQFILNKSVPFGSLFSGLQVSNIAYLWSLEFVGTISAPWMTRWKRFKLGALIAAALLLAAVVGPSSAILMIPRQSSFLIYATNSWLVGSESPLLPAALKAGLASKPSADLVLRDKVYPEPYMDFEVPDAATLRIASSYFDNVTLNENPESVSWYNYTDYFRAHTVIPPLLLGDVASIPNNYTPPDTVVSFNGSVASAAMFCGKPMPVTTENATSDIEFVFPGGDNIKNVVSQGQVLQSRTNNTNLQFMFRSPPASHIGRVSLLMLIVLNATILDLYPSVNYTGITAAPCLLRASWPSADVNVTLDTIALPRINWALKVKNKYTIDQEHYVPFSRSDIWEWDGWQASNPFTWVEPAVDIDPAWIEQVVFDLDQNRGIAMTAMDGIIALFEKVWSLSLNNSTAESIQLVDDSYYVSSISQALTALVASSMSTFSCATISACSSGDWSVNSTGDIQYYGLGPAPGHGLDTRNTTGDRLWFQPRFYINAKGYGFQAWPAVLAACILGIYCIVTITFMVFSLATGVSSNSWDSAGEVATLALYSKPPKGLGHMSAGLNTTSVFRQRVSVMENADQDLELVFDGGTEHRTTVYQELKYNKWY